MAEHHNAATRLRKIFREGQDPAYSKKPAYEVWASIFSVEGDRSIQGPEVARLLGLMLRQLNGVGQELAAKGYTDDVYEDDLDSLRWTLNPLHLHETWGEEHWERIMNAETALRFWSEMLDDEEDPADATDVEDKQDEVDAFASRIAGSSLAEPVKAFVLEQLRVIRRAFRDYAIAGAEAFGEAVFRCRFLAMRHEELWDDLKKDENAREALHQLSEYWQQLLAWSGHAHDDYKQAVGNPTLMEVIRK